MLLSVCGFGGGLVSYGELRARKIAVGIAEQPRGATAFSSIIVAPPTSEEEFVALWKLYIACLLHGVLSEEGISNKFFVDLDTILVRERLVKGGNTLNKLLIMVEAYVKRLFHPKEVEGQVAIDPNTGLPIGFTGKIVFSDRQAAAAPEDVKSIDDLLKLANDAFADANLKCWLLFDRLDVAFTDSHQLEANALRALFRVYLDIMSLDALSLKIFLRTDIWDRITSSGFREASHITKHTTITWNRNSLLNLIAKRVLYNADLKKRYASVNSPATLSEYEELFYGIFPKQVDIGDKKPSSLDWLLSRTQDGHKINAPRELIHFLNSLREVQVQRMEQGVPEPEGSQLFERTSFKEALPKVSKVRLEQTIYAEYPDEKRWIETLKGEKTLQTLETLEKIWKLPKSEALVHANRLQNIGVFELRGEKDAPEYWIPFLYRDALNTVQGTAD